MRERETATEMKFLKWEQIGLKHKRDQYNTSNSMSYRPYPILTLTFWPS